jgi:hypothetical protein
MMCPNENWELLFYCDSSLQIQLCALDFNEVGVARSSSSYYNVHTVSGILKNCSFDIKQYYMLIHSFNFHGLTENFIFLDIIRLDTVILL